jgi:Mg-chelatase subunit ChlI
VLSSISLRSGICALTPCGLRVEVELAVIDFRHVGEALAERIQSQDVGIDRAQAQRHRIDPVLELRAQLLDLALLVIKGTVEGCGRMGLIDSLARALAELHAQSKGGAEDAEHEDAEDGEHRRMRKIELQRPRLACRKPD